MSIYREPVSSSEHLACPRCGNGEFLLRPDGKIICADDDCYAYVMLRWVTHAASLAIAGLALEKVLDP